MAKRRRRLGSIAAAHLAVAFVVAALAAGLVPVIALGLARGLAGAPLDAYVLRVLGFTLLQAGLSTFFSVALGVPLAIALHRLRFRGSAVVSGILTIPMALPPIVAILGLVAVFGRNGWLGGMLDIYGLQGILAAHVFFNMPLAARLSLGRLEAIPAENVALARQLGLDRAARFRHLVWPALRPALPGIASLIFLLCAASFAVVLTLGGGPAATTLEVAIYQALRFDFDPARATVLALVQLVLCWFLVWLVSRWARDFNAFAPNVIRSREPLRDASTAWDAAILGLAAGLVVLPLLALGLAGLSGRFATGPVARAVAASAAVAVPAAAIAVAIAYALARRGTLIGLMTLIVPPAVLATGWFVIAVRLGVVNAAGPVLVVAMNALMALPFALGALAPAIRETASRHDRLCATLAIRGFDRLRLIDIPVLARPAGLAFAYCLAVSLGDLTAITFFGSQDFVTLPSLVYRQMGAYRIDDAAATALVLMLLSFGLTAIASRSRPA